MKTPMSDKTPEMIEAIEDIFPGTKKAIAERHCPACNGPITPFRDALSQREYEISGLCQNCQYDLFGENNV